MVKILLTGSHGFIGSHVHNKLWKQGHIVTPWDLRCGVNILKIKPLLTENYDMIIHLAAQLEILGVDPIQEIDLNIKGTVKMLEICRKFDIPKFVFASSADVYGEPEKLPSNQYSPVRPMWSYGSSKAACEIYCNQYNELYGMEMLIIRPSIVTGVGEWYGRFVTLSMARMRKREPILVFGDGNQTRDFVDVRDITDLICLASLKKNVFNPLIINAGSGKNPSIKDVAKFLSGLSKSKIEFINPEVGELGRKPHEQIHQQLDMQRVKATYEWQPKHDLKTTLKEEYNWILGMSDKEFREWIKNPRY